MIGRDHNLFLTEEINMTVNLNSQAIQAVTIMSTITGESFERCVERVLVEALPEAVASAVRLGRVNLAKLDEAVTYAR
jgi:cellobiose-specific phosphotransferase system component IIC